MTEKFINKLTPTNLFMTLIAFASIYLTLLVIGLPMLNIYLHGGVLW